MAEMPWISHFKVRGWTESTAINISLYVTIDGSKTLKIIAISAGGGALVLILLIVLVVFFILRRR